MNSIFLFFLKMHVLPSFLSRAKSVWVLFDAREYKVPHLALKQARFTFSFLRAEWEKASETAFLLTGGLLWLFPKLYEGSHPIKMI